MSTAPEALLDGLKRLVVGQGQAVDLQPGWFDVVEDALAEGGYYIAPIGRAADHPTARATDPRTSDGTRTFSMRAGSQRHKLLQAFGNDSLRGGDGITDEQAMEDCVGVRADSEYATRCSELRNAGWIIDTGKDRKGNTGTPRIVCSITDAGQAELRRLAS